MRSLARAITIVENELDGHQDLLRNGKFRNLPVVGVTGPPGAGKSTLINALLHHLIGQGKKAAVVAVDPTSPFNFGSLLGDRVRMSDHFLNENVFIRSLATRWSLGGLSAKAIEITDVLRLFDFDIIIVETVGVGQSEVEIAGLADTTVLVLVPEAGDEVQAIKSGIMEIADIYVVNKADRDGASLFVKNLVQLVSGKHYDSWVPKVIKAVASKNEGIAELLDAILAHHPNTSSERKTLLMAERAYRLIQNQRMKDVNRKDLEARLVGEMKGPDFNLYKFVEEFQ